MGLLDELKKLTKPYDDEDYLEEDLAEPVRAPGRAADARSYASYAEAPRSAEPVQPTRRPYVFSNQRAARQQQAADPYAQQDYGLRPAGVCPAGLRARPLCPQRLCARSLCPAGVCRARPPAERRRAAEAAARAP